MGGLFSSQKKSPRDLRGPRPNPFQGRGSLQKSTAAAVNRHASSKETWTKGKAVVAKPAALARTAQSQTNPYRNKPVVGGV